MGEFYSNCPYCSTPLNGISGHDIEMCRARISIIPLYAEQPEIKVNILQMGIYQSALGQKIEFPPTRWPNAGEDGGAEL